MKSNAANCVWLLTTLGGILVIVSCATTYWRDHAFSREGLWQSCPLDSCRDFEFVDNDGLDSDINIVRAFMLLGILLIFIATLVQFLGGCCCERSCNLPVYTLNILSLICLITAMAYYATHFDNGLWEFAWSYYLGWAGTGVYGLGVVLVFLCGCKE